MTTAETKTILESGAAPNPDCNTTVAEGRRMTALLSPFFKVIGIVINTTVAWPVEASMVPIEKVEIPDDKRLFLHVQVESQSGSIVSFGVANWLRIVVGAGLHDAIVGCLTVAKSDWLQDQALAAKVAALPGIVAQVVVIDPPIAPPSPDWEHPTGEGWLGNRAGDLSPVGTAYTSPSGVKWTKSLGHSMFSPQWSRS